MSSINTQRGPDKVNFSISAKLITIISVILIISLGSFTALVSWLIQADLKVSAEENNFDINRRTALEAETMIDNLRSGSRMLIQTITAFEPRPAQTIAGVIRQSTDFFFAENPQIVSVFFDVPGRGGQVLNNRQFFHSADMDETLAASFFAEQKEALASAGRGETLLRNAAPYFLRPVMALFFPCKGGGSAGVLFSAESANNNFASGINRSWMIDNEGGILFSADYNLVKEGINTANLKFIRSIFDSPEKSGQQLLEEDIGVFKPSGSVNPGSFQAFRENAKQFFTSLANKISGNTSVENADETEGTGSANSAVSSGEGGILRFFQRSYPRMLITYTKLTAADAVVITGVEYDKVFEGITAATKRNIYFTICVLCVSVFVIWLFSRTISLPVKSLTGAVRQIEEGIFKPELDAGGRDEIGVLTNNFKEMCSSLSVFGSFSNREAAVRSMRGEIKPEGLAKFATVIFCDIQDFSSKVESFSKFYGAEASDKIFNWLNKYFSEMIECVEKTNGVVDKFIGDAVMAHWGAVSSSGSPRKDAFNGIKAALMMRKAIFFLNKPRRKGDPGSPPIRIGCGINSGIVSAGQIGNDSRKEYTVIGEPVNFASRIEILTKANCVDILISEETWKLAGDRFICEEMPPVTLEGQPKPLRTFAVVNFSGEMKGPQTLDEMRALLS